MTHEPNALLPCPFCGREGKWASGDYGIPHPWCDYCHLKRRDTKQWNTRHPVQQAPACDGLREALEGVEGWAELMRMAIMAHADHTELTTRVNLLIKDVQKALTRPAASEPTVKDNLTVQSEPSAESMQPAVAKAPDGVDAGKVIKAAQLMCSNAEEGNPLGTIVYDHDYEALCEALDEYEALAARGAGSSNAALREAYQLVHDEEFKHLAAGTEPKTTDLERIKRRIFALATSPATDATALHAARLEGAKFGLEAAMDKCDPRVAQNDFQRGLVEATNRINQLSPEDVVKGSS